MGEWEKALVNLAQKDIENICRLCLGDDDLKEIKEVEYLTDLLGILSGEQVEHDETLPQNICGACIYKLEEISDFIDLVKYNYSCLKQVCNTKSHLKTISPDDPISQQNKICEYYYEVNEVARSEKNKPGAITGEVVDMQIIHPVLVKVEVLSENEDEECMPDINKIKDLESNEHMSKEESRLLRRRAGNRRAAAKRRKKMHDYLEGLVKELDSLENINKSFKSQIKELETEKHYLLNSLSKYKCSKQHLKTLEEKLKQKGS